MKCDDSCSDKKNYLYSTMPKNSLVLKTMLYTPRIEHLFFPSSGLASVEATGSTASYRQTIICSFGNRGDCHPQRKPQCLSYRDNGVAQLWKWQRREPRMEKYVMTFFGLLSDFLRISWKYLVKLQVGNLQSEEWTMEDWRDVCYDLLTPLLIDWRAIYRPIELQTY